MRRLLTGYAVSFNCRHRRHGHLFQNRYKSILCEEEPYLKQLVGYIHLNPFRARIVETIQALETYPLTGHCALMGQKGILVMNAFSETATLSKRSWQVPAKTTTGE